jgi:hypothetical protein
MGFAPAWAIEDVRVKTLLSARKALLRNTHDWTRRALGYRIVHCVGDSHAAMFRVVNSSGRLKRTVIRATVVGGATAMGVANPNSRTNALQKFDTALRHVPRRDPIITMLGEVDCGFVIWYRAQKYGEPIDAQFELSLSRYQHFLERLVEQGFEEVIVCSAPLPTIRDEQTWGEVANARREVTASQLERTHLTLKYNMKMAEYCADAGLKFIDLDPDLLDVQTGLIRPEYVNRDPLDHHLDGTTVTVLLTEKLRSLGFS